MAREQRGGFFRRLLILIVLVGLAFAGLAAFRAGPAPSISIEPELPGIGKRTAIHIRVEEPKRGVSGVRIELVQGERVEKLADRGHKTLEPWEFWGERTARDELTVEVGSETLRDLEPGQATLRVLAERAPAWLRRPAPAVAELTLDVKLRPPSVQVLSSQTYVAQGGAEVVVYRVGETAARDGVQAGTWWFPGHPLPGAQDERQRFALFAAPYDLTDAAAIRLVAADDVGNEARVAFVERYTPRPIRTDTIQLSDAFMSKVVPAILDHTPGLRDRGDLLQNYLMINGELREQNARTLIELGERSAREFLWTRPFLPMSNAKVMSAFADRRTYVYEGRAVDHQDHLGFDLASTRMADIQAANDGVVLLGRFFGIYGNAVVLDHGYGLMSLYGHLSSLSVEEGQRVERGQRIGRSGETGLAGGDHLHFTMLLQGLAVDPREWWDGHWIHDRLELKLGEALPFER